MTVVGPYGTIVSRDDVEQAYAATLGLWIEAHLEGFEKQRGLAFETVPRMDTIGIYGGIDPETFQQDNLPALIVNCKPVDEPELAGSGEYSQWYEATVVAVCEGTDERDARWLADAYGTAVLGAISQNASLGGFADDTRLMLAPNAEFIDPDKRRFARALTVFRSLVVVVNRRLGPPTPPPIGQQPGNLSTVAATTVTVTAVPLG